MEWQILFYNQKVESETLSFPAGILANFIYIAEMIEEFGPAVGSPYNFKTKLKKPRKSHYKKDEQAIAAFKKTSQPA